MPVAHKQVPEKLFFVPRKFDKAQAIRHIDGLVASACVVCNLLYIALFRFLFQLLLQLLYVFKLRVDRLRGATLLAIFLVLTPSIPSARKISTAVCTMASLVILFFPGISTSPLII